MGMAGPGCASAGLAKNGAGAAAINRAVSKFERVIGLASLRVIEAPSVAAYGMSGMSNG
jgi:hypothetical protein